MRKKILYMLYTIPFSQSPQKKDEKRKKKNHKEETMSGKHEENKKIYEIIIHFMFFSSFLGPSFGRHHHCGHGWYDLIHHVPLNGRY